MPENDYKPEFSLLLEAKLRRRRLSPPTVYYEKLFETIGLGVENWRDKIQKIENIELEYLRMSLHGGFEPASMTPLVWVRRRSNIEKSYNQEVVSKFSAIGEQRYLAAYNMAQFNKLKKYAGHVFVASKGMRLDEYDRSLLQKWKNAFLHWFVIHEVNLSDIRSGGRTHDQESQSFSDKQLAEIYLKCLLETGACKPSQSILAQRSPVSQSTWSRKFKNKEFWKSVNNEIELVLNQKDNLIQAQSIAQDELARLRSLSFQNTTKSMSEHADSLPSDDLSEFDEVEQTVDDDNLARLSDNELRQEIIDIDPQYSMKKLHNFTRDKLEILFKGLN